MKRFIRFLLISIVLVTFFVLTKGDGILGLPKMALNGGVLWFVIMTIYAKTEKINDKRNFIMVIVEFVLMIVISCLCWIVLNGMHYFIFCFAALLASWAALKLSSIVGEM